MFSPNHSPNTVLTECDSTNRALRTLAEQGAPHGTWISALRQTAGRGRQGNVWVSEPGNLYLSILLVPRERLLWTWIPLAVALGVRTAIVELYPSLASRIQVKWPNDLWLDSHKLCGTLCEGVGNSGRAFIIAGIGLNVASAPAVSDQQTISLASVLGPDFCDLDAVRTTVIDSVLAQIKEFETLGETALQEKYNRCAAFPTGSEITWNGGTHTGRVLGLGLSGELLVCHHPDGQTVSLTSDEVRKVRTSPT